MLHCAKCKKDVERFGLPIGVPDADKIAAGAREAARKAGRLILFNPPPVEPLPCPNCSTPLEDRRG
jgi:hypothetical protein